MNSHTLERYQGLSPACQKRYVAAERACQSLVPPIQPEIVQGRRSWAEQAAEYAVGRQPLEAVNELRQAVGASPLNAASNERPVTWAEPGDSMHNYGMALDAAPFVAGKPVWTVDATFLKMVEVFRSAGFICGIDWEGKKEDPDHFQYTGRFGTSPDAEMKRLYAAGGVEAVWSAAETERA